LTFFLRWVIRKKISKTKKLIIGLQKIGFAEEGTSIREESKNKAGLLMKR